MWRNQTCQKRRERAFYFILFLIFLNSELIFYLVCTRVCHTHTCASVYVDQRTTCRKYFFPPTMWIPGFKPEWSGLAESPFTHSVLTPGQRWCLLSWSWWWFYKGTPTAKFIEVYILNMSFTTWISCIIKTLKIGKTMFLGWWCLDKTVQILLSLANTNFYPMLLALNHSH